MPLKHPCRDLLALAFRIRVAAPVLGQAPPPLCPRLAERRVARLEAGGCGPGRPDDAVDYSPNSPPSQSDRAPA